MRRLLKAEHDLYRAGMEKVEMRGWFGVFKGRNASHNRENEVGESNCTFSLSLLSSLSHSLVPSRSLSIPLI